MIHPETIKVASENSADGFYILNKSDFNAAIHKEWSPVQVQPKPAAPEKKVK